MTACLSASVMSFYRAAAVSGPAAGSGVRGALTGAAVDVMCRASSSGRDRGGSGDDDRPQIARRIVHDSLFRMS